MCWDVYLVETPFLNIQSFKTIFQDGKRKTIFLIVLVSIFDQSKNFAFIILIANLSRIQFEIGFASYVLVKS